MSNWATIPCPLCGTEHRDDCPNKFEIGVTEVCGCGDGCNSCDWQGTFLRITGGHRRAMLIKRLAGNSRSQGNSV